MQCFLTEHRISSNRGEHYATNRRQHETEIDTMSCNIDDYIVIAIKNVRNKMLHNDS